MEEHGFNAFATMHPALVTDHLHSELAKFHHPPPIHVKYITFKTLIIDVGSALIYTSEFQNSFTIS